MTSPRRRLDTSLVLRLLETARTAGRVAQAKQGLFAAVRASDYLVGDSALDGNGGHQLRNEARIRMQLDSNRPMTDTLMAEPDNIPSRAIKGIAVFRILDACHAFL